MLEMRVAVIRAGISGLVAATTLAKGGAKVVLSEKGDYLGGQAKTVTVNGCKLDIGFMVFKLREKIVIHSFSTISARGEHRRSKVFLYTETVSFRGFKFLMDSTEASNPLPQVEVAEACINENSINGCGESPLVRRKRGRPRKHLLETRERLASLENHVPKRGWGRPPSTRKLQLLATVGRPGVDTVGPNLTPHVLNVLVGEDICRRILSVVVEVSPQIVCVLSAVGIVRLVEMCPAGYFGGDALRYEGCFPIVTLSGIFTLTEAGHRKGHLRVALADADSSVFSGLVVGSLIAAEPTQIVLGSFKESKKTLLKTESAESATTADGLGGFNFTQTTIQLPEIGEDFIATPFSPHPKPPNSNADQDVDHTSLQSPDQSISEPSDHASGGTMPDN